jgi:hypothetical protein
LGSGTGLSFGTHQVHLDYAQIRSGSSSSRNSRFGFANVLLAPATNWSRMFSQVEVRGCVSSEPFVGEGPAGELVAFLLSNDVHAGRPEPTCEIIDDRGSVPLLRLKFRARNHGCIYATRVVCRCPGWLPGWLRWERSREVSAREVFAGCIPDCADKIMASKPFSRQNRGGELAWPMRRYWFAPPVGVVG